MEVLGRLVIPEGSGAPYTRARPGGAGFSSQGGRRTSVSVGGDDDAPEGPGRGGDVSLWEEMCPRDPTNVLGGVGVHLWRI